ncbi:MAG: DUF2975 domain-containing protein [Clostridia bacterium]|nr:DUF2975 domain-containing protein [Clostridia bacterium]
MPRIPTKVSVIISIAFSGLLFAFSAAAAFLIPMLADLAISARNSAFPDALLGPSDRVWVIILLYIALTVIAASDVLMFFLLIRVRKGLVFTDFSVALLRHVAWGCFALSAVACAMSVFFRLSLVVAFLAAFLGFCLRVFKNAVEEAAEIKSENDLTV